jgi:hypothetical protein
VPSSGITSAASSNTSNIAIPNILHMFILSITHFVYTLNSSVTVNGYLATAIAQVRSHWPPTTEV